jgi:hypothetical protein
VFSRKRSHPSAIIYVGVSPLPECLRYPYLGATFQSDFRWHSHCNRIISASFKAAFEVSRIITSRGPDPKIIRQLTLAMVLPVITYGWPFWKPPTVRHWAKLEAALCLPLRCCLGLPANVHRLGLFIEFGLPNLHLLHQEYSMTYAHRLSLLPPDRIARRLFYEQYDMKVPVSSGVLTPFGSQVKAIEASWSIDHSSPALTFKRDLRKKALLIQIDELINSHSSRILCQLSLKPLVSSYIMLDSRINAVLRARIRLNRNKLNYNQYRRNLVLSPSCPVCPGVDETVHHVLFDCPTFDAARFHCFNTLDSFSCPASFEVLTGDVSSVPPRHRRFILTASAKFLHVINFHRPI